MGGHTAQHSPSGIVALGQSTTGQSTAYTYILDNGSQKLLEASIIYVYATQTCTILRQKMTHINHTYRTIWLLPASFPFHALSPTTCIFAAFVQVFAVRVMLTLNSTVTNSKNVLWAGHCE